ncbi:MAG: succinate dehydrogenase cytochrome b subunit [Planctomycetota bacterium]
MSQLVLFVKSSIGKKILVAATGVILFLYLFAHMFGNLKVFAGPESINGWAEFLHSRPAMLWGARLVLLAAVLVHVVLAVLLWLEGLRARPKGYLVKRYKEADYASRTMIVTGPMLGFYVVYHILHFTTGSAHPSFDPKNVYANVINGFSYWPVSAVYIVAMLLLGVHLYHGAWSLFQTLGLNHPRYNPWRRGFSVLAAVFLVAGFVSVPIAVLTGQLTVH